jgi:hypothetical protein
MLLNSKTVLTLVTESKGRKEKDVPVYTKKALGE